MCWNTSFSQVVDLTHLDQQAQLADPMAFCNAINAALEAFQEVDENGNPTGEYSFPNNSICFIMHDYDSPESRKWQYFYTLRCRIKIREGQTLNIPTGMVIELEDGGGFDLSGNGSIVGDNYARSKITNDGIGPAITMGGHGPDADKCQGCHVSDISIEGKGDPLRADGITITEGSEMNDVSSVRFAGLENGIRVEGNCNTFSDLSFFQVAIDRDDCIATWDDPTAVLIYAAHQNTFTNINHTRSIGAISVKLELVSTNNRVLNLAVEQEDSPCSDPAIYVTRGSQSIWNYFVTNFNGATYKIAQAEATFKEKNILLPWVNPSTLNLSACNAPICNLE